MYLSLNFTDKSRRHNTGRWQHAGTERLTRGILSDPREPNDDFYIYIYKYNPEKCLVAEADKGKRAYRINTVRF